jgi:hypothetical protein
MTRTYFQYERSLVLCVASCIAGVQPPPPHVSGPQPGAEFTRSPAELEQTIAKAIDGFTPADEPWHGTLESFTPTPLALQRGQCYVVVLRLDPGATFSAHAQRGLGFVFLGAGYPRHIDVDGGPGVAGPGGAGAAGCPQNDVATAFDLQARWGLLNDRSHIHDLGRGGYTAQLYSKPISDDELRAQRREVDHQIAAGRAQDARDQERAATQLIRACTACHAAYLACIADWRRGATRDTCERELDDCVSMSAPTKPGSLAHVSDCPAEVAP